MTAVNPTRLRHQIQELMSHYESPLRFHQELRGLFSLYANYALRFGDSANLRPLIAMYHLPHPVIRQLNLDLKPRIEADPESTLALADELWQDTYYEIKRTAIFLIGSLPIDDPQLILQRVEQWLTPDLDQVLKSDLLSIGTVALQEAFPNAWESFVLSRLSQTEPKQISLGIQALAAGSRRPDFKNLPAVFRLASPFIRNPHNAYTRDLESLIEALAERSANETAYFLRQTLAISTSPATDRLIKSCLSSFPEDVQADLKTALNKEP